MDEVDITEYRQGWVDHPHTRHIRKKVSHAAEREFQRLKDACKNSSDPKVTAAYADWVSSSLALRLFDTGAFHE